ncbi:hypothetical protein CEXT_535541 [Caerostris extrusa]|uniref:C2H2-type domain-containing protein n=1 Tax=Caerostris extrusa TaxID=172846 RepID=A0AAV4RM55_CAEEX|nr:hypothetical protein CEXT_535541 [Caerostris extrusa]
MKTYNVSNEAPSQKRSLKCQSKQQAKQTCVAQENQNAIQKEINFECVLCKMQFPTDISLNKHYSSHVKKAGLICHICGRTFFFKREFEEHVQSHTKYKPYVCDICQQAFSVETSLKFHYKSAHSVKTTLLI